MAEKNLASVQEINQLLKQKTKKKNKYKEWKVSDEDWKGFGLPVPRREYMFHPTRRWRADYCWIDAKLIIEIEGVNPKAITRHTSISGFIEDCNKYNFAAELGWVVLRYVPKKVNYEQVKRVYDMLMDKKNEHNS